MFVIENILLGLFALILSVPLGFVFSQFVLRQALKGIPESIQALKMMSEEYEVVGEKIFIVLSSGYSFEELFGKDASLKL